MSSNVREPNIQIKERSSEFDLLSHYSFILSFDNYINIYVCIRAHVRVLMSRMSRMIHCIYWSSYQE